MNNRVYKARQLRRALQLWASTLEDESLMMEIADIYPGWRGNSRSYKAGDIVAWGENDDGETQLYTVLQDHVSQDGWSPEKAPSLFKKVGFTDSGIALWTQPLGASDSYEVGDIVWHGHITWVSDVDGNVWEPGVYGWTAVE
ncbi:MAG: alpha-amylase [Clostridia bacterium]|nr:alpha-amylase [Clostridia bacterium]